MFIQPRGWQEKLMTKEEAAYEIHETYEGVEELIEL